MSKVDIEIGVEELKRLPDNASYNKRSGQASINVRFRNDTIYIMGTCDSLQRLVNYYERLYNKKSNTVQKNETKAKLQKENDAIRKTDPPWIALIIIAVPIILIAGFIIVIKISYKQSKHN